ncbi:MAG: hypothetical protein ACKV1O_31000 [Saprospiraceae bacterium]
MARKKRRTTYRRRRVGAMNQGGIMESVKQGALVAGGYAAGSMLGNSVGFLKENPLFAAAAQIVAGIATGSFVKGPTGNSLGAGMAAAGVLNLLKATAPSVASTLGIAGVPQQDFYPGSFLLPGVAGVSGATGNEGLLYFD